MASTALLSTLTKRDATTLATVARAQFPDKLDVTLKPEAKAQHELLLKLGGNLVAHHGPGLPWDSGWRYDQDHGYEQLELKASQPLEKSLVLTSLAELCGVANDAKFVDFRPKDRGSALGLEKLLNQDHMSTYFSRARSRDPGLTVLDLELDRVQVEASQGMRFLIVDPSCDSLALLSREGINNLLDDAEIINNSLRQGRFQDSSLLYLATRGDGPHVFYFSNFGLNDDEEQITRAWSSKKDWEVVVKVSADGEEIEEIWCLWDDREHDVKFTSIDEFASTPASNPITISRRDSHNARRNSQFAEENKLHWRSLGSSLTFMCLTVGPESPFHVGLLSASQDDLVDAIDEHIARDPRYALGDRGSNLMDPRVIEGEDATGVRHGVVSNSNVMRSRRRHRRDAAPRCCRLHDHARASEAVRAGSVVVGRLHFAQVFASFAMPFDEFKRRLKEEDWTPRQKRFMHRYFVAAGISEYSPGCDFRAQNMFIMAVVSDTVSAAWCAEQNPFDRADMSDSSDTDRCVEMIDDWILDSDPDYKPDADRDTIIKRLIGDVVYNANSREVKVGEEFFVLEAVTDTHARVRAVTVVEQTSDGKKGPLTFYSDVLVRSSANVRKCFKDYIIRILFQAIWAFEFAQAGLQLLPWPTQGVAGLNAMVVGTVGTGAAATQVWLPTSIMHGEDATTKKHSHAAPSGATLTSSHFGIEYSDDDAPNTFLCYLFGSGCGRPALFVSKRDAFMGLASFALEDKATPFAILDGRRKADPGRIIKKTHTLATLVVNGSGGMSQGAVANVLTEATRRSYGSEAGVLPYVSPGADDTGDVLRRSFEAAGLALLTSLADAKRPRVVPAPESTESDEEDGPASGPASRLRSAAATIEPAPKRPRTIGTGIAAAAGYTPEMPGFLPPLVRRAARTLTEGGTVFPAFGSQLAVPYEPLALLDDKQLSKEDLITKWTREAWPRRADRVAKTRPEFVLATSHRGAGTWTYEFYPSRARYWLTNIRGTGIHHLVFVFEPVGVTTPIDIESGTMERPVTNITKTKLDERFGTAKAIEKDDDDDSDEELYYKYEKDQPAGAILKFVVNKYLDVYGKDNRRVS